MRTPPRAAQPEHRVRRGRRSDPWRVGRRRLQHSACGSGEALAVLAGAGHAPVIKPWPLRPAVPGGFTLDDFTAGEDSGTVTCPNHVTRRITRTRKVTFGVACAGCPLRHRCATAASGRLLTLHEHDALQRAHRARAADPGFRATYREHRPMAGRSIAWLTRGCRRVPYRGVTRTTPGSTCAPPRSTSGGCSPSASPATRPPGPWRPPDPAGTRPSARSASQTAREPAGRNTQHAPARTRPRRPRQPPSGALPSRPAHSAPATRPIQQTPSLRVELEVPEGRL
jgi:hypothetical protein